MKNDLESLRAQIWKRPDDRDLFAVYGDALATSGDAEQAEFIQLALLDTPTAAQAKRMEALRKKHRGAWLGAAKKFVWTWEEDEARPGFLALVQTAMPRFNKGFEQIRALGPRLVVRITAPKSNRDVREFAALPLGTMYGFEFNEDGSAKEWVNDFFLRTVAPSLKGIKHLSILAGHFAATREAHAELLSHLDGLERLRLVGDSGDGLLPDLSTTPFRKSLRRLDVSGALSRKDATKLARLFPKAHLRFGYAAYADD